MRLLLLGSAIGLLVSSSSGQGLGVEWSRSYGSSFSDEGLFISQRADGKYFIAGGSGIADGDFAGAVGPGGGLMMLVDSIGNLVWTKRIGAVDYDFLWDGCPTADGGYLLVGGINSDTDTTISYGQRDAWVVKVDSSGNVLWERHYGGWMNEIATSIAPTADGGFLVAGEMGEDAINAPGTNGSHDVWVLRLDPNGNEVWQRCLGGSSGEITPIVDATNDGGAILSCTTYSGDGDITTGLAGMMDIWVVKLDSAGDLEWSNTYGSSTFDYNGSVMETGNGQYLLTGAVSGLGGDVSEYSGGTSDGWCALLDASGTLIWERSCGGSEEEFILGAIEIPAGYLIYGNTQSSNGDVDVQYGGGDAWLLALNGAGQLVWDRTYGGASGDLPWCIISAQDGLMMVGQSLSGDGLLPSNQGWSDVWLLKLSAATNLIGGTLYADLNEDGTQGATEAGLAYRLVQLQNTNELALTDAEGLYEFTVAGMGTFTTEAPEVPYYTKDPQVRTTVLDSIGVEDLTLHFRYEPQGDIKDLEVSITALSPFRPGQPVMYDVLCRNIGTSPVDATLDLLVSTALSIDALTPAASLVNGNELHWDLGILAPFGHAHVLVDATVSPDSFLGAIVTTTATIGPLVLDQDTSNNSVVHTGGVITAVDPNAIHVDHTTCLEAELSDIVLEYFIQFQNTGNDTAFYVRVDNVLPFNTELTSFEFVGASHPVQLLYDHRTRLMQFVFEDILLPDSNVNEPKSHGYIRYRLRPLGSLVEGDTVANSVAIYFDLNDPVITEPAFTLVVPEPQTWGVPEGAGIWYAPNPCGDVLTVRWNGPIERGELVVRDMLGRDLVRKALSGTSAEVHLASLASGTYLLTADLDGTRLSGKVVVE